MALITFLIIIFFLLFTAFFSQAGFFQPSAWEIGRWVLCLDLGVIRTNVCFLEQKEETCT